MKNYLVTGASSGLGLCLKKRLIDLPDVSVYSICNDDPKTFEDDKSLQIDFRKKDQQEIVLELNNFYKIDKLDGLINCAGINKIDWFPNLKQSDWESVMAVNVSSILYVTQALLPKLAAAKGTVVNVVSNAFRVPMTHSWLYNASKGAAAIVTRQMARELQKTHSICVFGVCPNKMKNTKMSNYIDSRVQELRGWSKEQAEKYQLAALVPGFETDPDWIAELVVWLLSENHRHKYLSGCLLELGY